MPKRRRQAEEQYHVEVIEKARVSDEGDWWGGYSSEENSWEPTENVEGCKRLLKSFWENVGMDNQDHHPGDMVEPSREWIAQERAFFQEAFGGKSSKKSKHDHILDTTASSSTIAGPSTSSSNTKHIIGKATKHKAKPKKPGWELISLSDDSDDEPVIITAKKGKKRQSSVISITSDESETPLSRSVPTASKTRKIAGKGKAKEIAPTATKKKPSADHPPSTTAGVLSDSSDESGHDSLFSDRQSPAAQKDKSDVPTTGRAAAPKLSIKLPPAKSSAYVSQSATSPGVGTPQTASVSDARVPAHRERQANPKVQMIPMQLIDKTGTASIPTKQKIAEKSGHLTSKPSPVVTTVPTPAPTGTGDLFPPNRSLANLSFKKKSTTTTNTEASPVVPSPSTSRSTQPRSSFFPEKETVHSPVTESGAWGNNLGWGNDNGWDDAGGGWHDAPVSRRASEPESPMVLTPDTAPISRRAAPEIPRQSSMQQQQRSAPNPLHDAEMFLHDMMSDKMAAPMDESAPEEPLRAAPPTSSIAGAVAKKVPVFNLGFTKKWGWHGELYIEAGPDRADRLCNVSLSELTDARPMGLRLDILYTSDVSVLRLKKFHEMTDLYMLLRACAPVQQCCKVSHAAEGDFETITTLSAWMTRKSQFAYADVYLDNDAVGLLVIFPSAITEVCNIFKVPAYLRDKSSLLAALVPWSLSPNEMIENMWTQPTNRIPFKGEINPELLRIIEAQEKTRRLVKNPSFAAGLRIHKFTPEIYSFLTRTPRSYCIWHTSPGQKPDTSKPDGTQWETRGLVAVLEECYAKNAGHKADVRVVFVHVSALATFRKLPALAVRRLKQPDMRIYSYGSHTSVPPNRWGLREIYPIGGVITFTASALREDVFSACRLIKLAEQHPLWVSYVHPYVLAAIFKRDYSRHDPATVVERDDFVYKELLELIEDGSLSLLYAPPISRSPCLEKNRTDAYDDPQIKWAEWVLNRQFSERKEMLAECVNMFEAAHPNVSDKNFMNVVEKEVLADLGRMQLQPSIMDSYRRFVVITESRSEDLDGVELTPVQKFEFRDSWFPSSSPH
ncbi:hypothetical protein BDY19DRAFT_913567 [Irpex rosettiformis]|uniref:Uncharacterized protein n=1 Tax=Irpex rosettiformis TaxID=378272 RepID=A0ACB8UJM5_9APHY|nr:hypothetical protein BDY19DRAFT_913567 [Irpex rosettiformis]